MYRCVWVPDGRAEPFFPLCPRRPCWIISPGTAAGLPPARIAAFAPRGIIHRPSPPYESSSPANCWGSYPAVLFAAPADWLIFSIHVHFRDAGLWAGMVGRGVLLSFSTAIQRQLGGAACSHLVSGAGGKGQNGSQERTSSAVARWPSAGADKRSGTGGRDYAGWASKVFACSAR